MKTRTAIKTMLLGMGAFATVADGAQANKSNHSIKVRATILDDFGWLFGKYSIVFNLWNDTNAQQEIDYNLFYDLALNMTVINLDTKEKAPIGTFHPKGTAKHRIGLSPGCSIDLLVPLMSHIPFSEEIPGSYKLIHNSFGELGVLTIPDTPKQDAEQEGGAGQPATAPESKLEGKEKPKPESEERSQ